MNALRPYLTFSGNCREAMEFYAECLGGEVSSIMSFAASDLKNWPREVGS
jgi:PhnB protein